MTRDDQDPDDGRPIDQQGRRALLQDLESIRTLLDDLERNATGIELAPPTGTESAGPGKRERTVDDDAAHIPVLREVVRPAPARPDDDGERVSWAGSRAASPGGAYGTRSAATPKPGSVPESASGSASTSAATAARTSTGTSTDTSTGASTGTSTGTSPDGSPDGSPRAAGTAAQKETQGELFDPRAFADRLLNDDWRRERDAILESARRSARGFDAKEDAPHGHARAALRDEHVDALRERLTAALAPRVDALLDDSLAALRAGLAETLRTELQRLLNDLADTAADAADRDPDETD